jgi:putative ABC transport system permease protein
LPVALKVHQKVRISEGRMFNPSVNEVVVGKGLTGHYKNMQLGSTLHFGRGNWKVVGIMTADGGSFESEVWGDIHNVQDDAQRGAYYADVRLKLAPGAESESLINRLADDPRINLQGKTETHYYQDQAVVANQMRALGMIVAVIMAVGAIFGAMNTMYAAVSSRTTEIGTLRALGFAPMAVMTSFLLESLVLAVAAGAIGILLAMPINGLSTTFGNFVTFSTLAFSFHVTFAIVIQALLFAAIMGVVGGWFTPIAAPASTRLAPGSGRCGTSPWARWPGGRSLPMWCRARPAGTWSRRRSCGTGRSARACASCGSTMTPTWT